MAHANTRLVATVRGDSTVHGTVTFEQYDEIAPTVITWNLCGNDLNSERGFHIHEFGDNTNGCTSAGPHCTLAFIITLINAIYQALTYAYSQSSWKDAWRTPRSGASCGRPGELSNGCRWKFGGSYARQAD